MKFFLRLVRDPRANYEQSLGVLRRVKEYLPHLITKSSIMVGFGEKDEEIVQTMKGILVIFNHTVI